MNSQEYQMNPQDYQMNPAYYPVTHVWDESLNGVVPHNSQDIDIDWESEDIQNQFSEMVSSLSNSTSPQGLDGTVTSGIVQGAGVYANESGPAGGMNASNSGGFNFQEQMPYSIDPALLPAPVPVPPGPFFAPEAPADDSIFAQEFDVDFGDDNVVRDVLGPNNQDARVQKRGKSNGNGKAKAPRRPKGATPDKPARAVRAFSCKSCRRKKTKCDGSPGHACSKCQKSGTACEIDGRDGRTSKTTIDKYESLRVALNAHLVRLAQICHHFRQKCNGPEELGQVAAGAAATLEVHRRRGIPIEPWRIQDILRTSDPSTNQLPGYRSRLVQVGQQAKQMTNTLAKLMVMLTQQDYYLWCDGCRLTDELFDSNPDLPSFDAKINAVFVTDMQDYIYKVLADEVDGIIAQHL